MGAYLRKYGILPALPNTSPWALRVSCYKLLSKNFMFKLFLLSSQTHSEMQNSLLKNPLPPLKMGSFHEMGSFHFFICPPPPQGCWVLPKGGIGLFLQNSRQIFGVTDFFQRYRHNIRPCCFFFFFKRHQKKLWSRILTVFSSGEGVRERKMRGVSNQTKVNKISTNTIKLN